MKKYLLFFLLVLISCGSSKSTYIAHYEEAQELYANKKYKESLDKYEQAVAEHVTSDPVVFNGYLQTAILYGMQGNFNYAHDILDELERIIKSVEQLSGGEKNKFLKEIAGAERQLKKLTRKADAKSRKRDEAKTENLYKRALKEFEANNLVLSLRLFKEVSDYKDADDYVEKIEGKLSSVVDKLFKEGFQLYADDKYKEAIKKFEDVLDVKPNHKDAIYYKNKAEKKIKVLESL